MKARDAVIGRPMLQKLYAAMTEENIENGIFIATCEYSKPAIEYGRKMNIKTLKLIDVLDMVRKTYDSQIDANKNYTISCQTCGEELVFKLFGDLESKTCINGHVVKNVFWNTRLQEPLCPRCGGKYRLVHGYRGSFYGCCNYPSCHQRKSRDEYEIEAGIKKRRKLPSYPDISFKDFRVLIQVIG